MRIVKMGILTARQRYRVSAGVFLYLTPNGGYCWYRHLAPSLGVETRHLSTDRFLTAREVETLIAGAGCRGR